MEISTWEYFKLKISSLHARLYLLHFGHFAKLWGFFQEFFHHTKVFKYSGVYSLITVCRLCANVTPPSPDSDPPCLLSYSLNVLWWELDFLDARSCASLFLLMPSFPRGLTGPSSYNLCCPLSKSNCCQMKKWWSTASPTSRTLKTSSMSTQPGEDPGKVPSIPAPAPHPCGFSSQERTPGSIYSGSEGHERVNVSNQQSLRERCEPSLRCCKHPGADRLYLGVVLEASSTTPLAVSSLLGIEPVDQGPMNQISSLGVYHSPVLYPTLCLLPSGPCRTTWSGAWCWIALVA